MAVIKLDRNQKIRLIKAIQDGRFDTEMFPDLLDENGPKLYLFSVDMLTEEQIDKIINNETSKQ